MMDKTSKRKPRIGLATAMVAASLVGLPSFATASTTDPVELGLASLSAGDAAGVAHAAIQHLAIVHLGDSGDFNGIHATVDWEIDEQTPTLDSPEVLFSVAAFLVDPEYDEDAEEASAGPSLVDEVTFEETYTIPVDGYSASGTLALDLPALGVDQIYVVQHLARHWDGVSLDTENEPVYTRQTALSIIHADTAARPTSLKGLAVDCEAVSSNINTQLSTPTDDVVTMTTLSPGYDMAILHGNPLCNSVRDVPIGGGSGPFGVTIIIDDWEVGLDCVTYFDPRNGEERQKGIEIKSAQGVFITVHTGGGPPPLEIVPIPLLGGKVSVCVKPI